MIKILIVRVYSKLTVFINIKIWTIKMSIVLTGANWIEAPGINSYLSAKKIPA